MEIEFTSPAEPALLSSIAIRSCNKNNKDNCNTVAELSVAGVKYLWKENTGKVAAWLTGQVRTSDWISMDTSDMSTLAIQTGTQAGELG